MSKKAKSEFGSGIVICLVKFTEHLSNPWAQRVCALIAWEKATDKERARWEVEAKQFPLGDSARFMLSIDVCKRMGSYGDNTPLGEALHMWAKGASEHFYDLNRKRAPKSLIALADLTLKIGHGFILPNNWSEKHWKEVWDLWKASTLEVEKMLGVKGDWGEW